MQPKARPHTQEQKKTEINQEIKKQKEIKVLSPKNSKAASMLLKINYFYSFGTYCKSKES